MINKEILDFTKKGIIQPVVQAVPDEFISNILLGQNLKEVLELS